MAKKKIKYPRVVTDVATASWPYLLEPDTEGQYADNKYKVRLLLPRDADFSDIDAAKRKALRIAIENEITPEWAALDPDMDIDEIYGPVIDGEDLSDEAYHDFMTIYPKSKFKVPMVDSAKRPLPKGVEPWGGDLIKANIEIVPYISEEGKGKNKKRIPCFTSYLLAVQLIEKRSQGESSANADAFGTYDGGYVADEADEDEDEVDGTEDF